MIRPLCAPIPSGSWPQTATRSTSRTAAGWNVMSSIRRAHRGISADRSVAARYGRRADELAHVATLSGFAEAAEAAVSELITRSGGGGEPTISPARWDRRNGVSMGAGVAARSCPTGESGSLFARPRAPEVFALERTPSSASRRMARPPKRRSACPSTPLCLLRRHIRGRAQDHAHLS
jgi:hypothetical protein